MKDAVLTELIDINRYLHDFTSALWVCGSLAMWLLCREAARQGSSREALLRVARKLRLLTVPSLLLALASGGVRAATFARYEHPGEITAATIAILVVKHVAFAGVVAWGLWVHWRIRAGRQEPAGAAPEALAAN